MGGLRAGTPAGLGQPGVEPGFGPEFDADARLGDIMRGERATKGKSLLDVQRELRIRASYVAAIENCDITAFDTPSFIAGYVRSYARYLGMDPDWTFRRFCTESGFQPTHGMAQAAAGPRPTRRPNDPAEALANPKALFVPQPESFWSGVEPRALGSLLVLFLVVAGLGYGGWSVLQQVQRVTLAPAETAPAVVVALDPVSGLDATDSPAAPDDLAALPSPETADRLYRPQILEAPVLTARDGPIAAIDPGLTVPPPAPEAVLGASAPAAGARPPGFIGPMPGGAMLVAAAVPNTPRAQAMAHGPQMPADQLAVRTVAPDAPAVELLTARPAWVRVSTADGTVLLEKIMDAGERFALPALEQPPQLRTGNSGAVYFAVNGRTYGPAAPGAQVVKGIELTPASLTARYAYADLAADPELAQMVAMAAVAPDAATTVAQGE